MNTTKAQRCCPSKKFVLLIAALAFLSACSNPFVAACNNNDTRRISWGSTIDVRIPQCWHSTDYDEVLTLTKEDKTAKVILQKTTPDETTQGSGLTLQESFPLSTGETLYALLSNPEDKDSQDIIDSIQIKSWSIAASSCVAPDYDYAQAINYTWQKINFALPYCWGAEESHSITDDPQLTLYKTEDGVTTRVNFWLEDPLNEKYGQTEELTLSGTPTQRYDRIQADESQADSTVYVLSTTPVWYIETNAPSDTQVELILNSLTFLP